MGCSVHKTPRWNTFLSVHIYSDIMQVELIIINGIWAIVIGLIMKQILAVKTAEAKLRLAKAEYYRERAKQEKAQAKEIKSSALDEILENLGIDLENPMVRKLIERYAKKFLDQLEKSEEQKINFVG